MAIIPGAAYPIWNALTGMWRVYTAIAVLFGVLAGMSCLTETSLPTEFYKIAPLLYEAGPVILVLLYGFPLR